MFTLDPQFEKDTFAIGKLVLCHVLLMNNAHYPWIIMVPEHPSASELMDLSRSERLLLIEECTAVAEIMKREFLAHKMNVATLGNMTPQLHMHIIARFKEDISWPSAIWGQNMPVLHYTPEETQLLIRRLHSIFSRLVGFTAAHTHLIPA